VWWRRARRLAYDVEADWLLLFTCNFRCAYCFFPPAMLGEKLVVHGSPSDWEDAFAATGRRWLLHVTGGEPFVYPGFVELCERLTRRHVLSINTNLSHRAVDDFAARVDPRRVHYVHAAVHPDERRRRGGLEAFVARVHALRDRGFTVLVSVVMTPDAIAEFPAVDRTLRRDRIVALPKAARGTWDGRWYPDAYTATERTAIAGWIDAARPAYAREWTAMGEAPTIAMLSDDRLLDTLPDYRGRLCGSGHTFVRIDPDGTVLRCGSGEQLGNVLARSVQLHDGPTACDTSYCPYFCEKYTRPPFVPAAVNRPS
jgi:MoaA/NifB/PqqE/SkfB family radical SAM enzyme